MKTFLTFLSEAKESQAKKTTKSSDQNLKSETKDAERGTLTVAFGRFNPPTVGHEKLLNVVSKVANKGDYKIYPSRSNDPKKNPLDPDTKISFMRKMYPKHGERIVNDENAKTIFDVLKRAYEDGYTGVNIVVGSDRQAEFEKLATKYNGDLYNFTELNIVSAGNRDPDSDDVSGMSASKLRKAAADGDFESFKKGVPKTLNHIEVKKLFNALRKSMNIKENYNLWEISPKLDYKNLREEYINNNIFKVGDIIENLNTGLIGKIIRRGANYLICVTEDNIMFKPWIYDVVEWINRSGVPANQREVGTKKLVKYLLSISKGQRIDTKNFINKHRKNNKN
jgi:hypothetical protein